MSFSNAADADVGQVRRGLRSLSGFSTPEAADGAVERWE